MIMKKITIAILVLLLCGIGGIFFIFTANEELKPPRDLEKPDKNQQKIQRSRIIDYLQKTILSPNFGGDVWVDYYEFGRQEKEIFLWVYAVEYFSRDGELEMGSGFSGPMALTIKDDSIQKHWQPREGENYSSSIKNKFPSKYQEDVLNFQARHQDILKDLKESVSRKAEEELIEAGADINLQVGETDVIELEANRTTGYSWHYNIKNEEILKVVSDDYKDPQNKKGVLGAPGKRILKIKALQKGSTVVYLEYYREWKPEKVEKSKEIRVQVGSGSRSGESDTNYISVVNKKLKVFDSEGTSSPEFIQKKGGKIICSLGSSPKDIKGRKYCLKKTSEGATGHTRRYYTYATFQKSDFIKIGFTVIVPECGNYPELQRPQCEKEVQGFDPDDLAGKTVKNLEN